MNQKRLPIQLRGMEERDESLVYNSWLKSFRASGFARNIPSDIYHTQQHDLIDRLIHLPHAVVLMAVDESDPDQIYGWIAGTHTGPAIVVHYVYCKQQWRRYGLAAKMVEALSQGATEPRLYFYTHKTKVGRGVLEGKKGWFYHPYLAWGQLFQREGGVEDGDRVHQIHRERSTFLRK